MAAANRKKAKPKASDPAPSTKGRRLKVFRTPIGFHDAYIAAPSRKAALEAWGAGGDLFAQGIAEQVTDPARMKLPLARPGEVIRVSRGSADEHARAVGLGPGRPSRSPAPSKPREDKGRRPSRAKLEAAEQALAALEKLQAEERHLLDRERQALDDKRRALDRRQAAALAKAADKRERARQAYEQAIDAWRG